MANCKFKKGDKVIIQKNIWGWKTLGELATVHKYNGYSNYTIITDRKIDNLKKGSFLNMNVSNLKKANVLLVELL